MVTVPNTFANQSGQIPAKQLDDNFTTLANAINSGSLLTGGCKLQYTNSSTITLIPWNGNSLVINSTAQPVPDAGITLANTGLSTFTRYYIYAYMNSGVMTLTASATGYAAQTGTGINIKSGDATRSLVGQVYIDGTGNFQDGPTVRYTRSWFNEFSITGNNALGANSDGITANAPTYTELTTGSGANTFRAGLVLWANERVFGTFDPQGNIATTANLHQCVGVNTGGTINTPTIWVKDIYTVAGGSNYSNGCVSFEFGANGGTFNGGTAVNEGYNYLVMYGATESSYNAVWIGNKNQTKIGYITGRR